MLQRNAMCCMFALDGFVLQFLFVQPNNRIHFINPNLIMATSHAGVFNLQMLNHLGIRYIWDISLQVFRGFHCA